MPRDIKLFIEPAITGAYCVVESDTIVFEGATEKGDHLVGDLSNAFGEHRIEPSEIRSVFTTTGPGGYTGTRVGIATVLGLIRAGKAKGFGIDLISLLFLAKRDAETVFLPAGKHESLIASREDPKSHSFVKEDQLQVRLGDKASVGVSAKGRSGSVTGEVMLLSGSELLELMIANEARFSEELTPVYGRTFGKH